MTSEAEANVVIVGGFADVASVKNLASNKDFAITLLGRIGASA